MELVEFRVQGWLNLRFYEVSGTVTLFLFLFLDFQYDYYYYDSNDSCCTTITISKLDICTTIRNSFDQLIPTAVYINQLATYSSQKCHARKYHTSCMYVRSMHLRIPRLDAYQFLRIRHHHFWKGIFMMISWCLHTGRNIFEYRIITNDSSIIDEALRLTAQLHQEKLYDISLIWNWTFQRLIARVILYIPT